jgi:predicted nuclease of predicted toxin-antitoxin system
LTRFLIDECTGRRLAILLKNAGYDVVFVGDWKPSATDEEVLRKAEEEDRILITDDKDFGELIFRLGKPSKGVILLRTSTTDPVRRFQLLEKILKFTDVKEKFVVVKDDAVRIRKIKF